MVFRPFLYSATSCASYLFGCMSHGKLAVVDPHVELVDDYFATDAALGSPITAVFETHVQADHVSGLLADKEKQCRRDLARAGPRSRLASAGSDGTRTRDLLRDTSSLSGSRRGRAASVLQASRFRRDVTAFRLNARPRPKTGSEPAFRRNEAEHVYTIEAAHNPEVAGSNPAPATQKGPGNRAFLLWITGAVPIFASV